MYIRQILATFFFLVFALILAVYLATQRSFASDASAHPSLELRTLPVASGHAILNEGTALVEDWGIESYKQSASVLTQTKNLFLFAFDDPSLVYLDQVKGTYSHREDGSLVWNYEDEQIKLQKVFKKDPALPYLDADFYILLKKASAKFAFVSLITHGVPGDNEQKDRNLVYWSNDKLETVNVEKVEDHPIYVNQPTRWMAVVDRYFAAVAMARGDTLPQTVIQPNQPQGGRISLVYPLQGKTAQISLRAYYGAKDLSVLRSVDRSLDTLVDLGFFTIVAYPLLKILKWFYSYVHNYGVAIILLTILVKILTFPLTYKSMKGMRKMADLQPELAKLQEKYKDDRARLNTEMLSFMRNRGYNPMAGCWPVLIQMPIFFALYQVLYSAVELYRAPFGLWLHDLSMKDPYYITPVLVGLTWFVQQKLQPNTVQDPMQRKIFQFMPLVFTLFMISLPSGLGIYFFVNALLSIVQQLVLNKKLGPSRTIPTHVTARSHS